MNVNNLTLRSRTPLTRERIEAYLGTDCQIVREVREPYVYEPHVIVEARATDDPYVASIRVERKRFWRL